MNLGDALAWLDRHQNLERILADERLRGPEPERMRRLADLMGDPQDTQPVDPRDRHQRQNVDGPGRDHSCLSPKG